MVLLWLGSAAVKSQSDQFALGRHVTASYPPPPPTPTIESFFKIITIIAIIIVVAVVVL